MATKSPGVYFTEVDNTLYSNATTDSTSTCVAIIGFATKGPIGTPTEITSASVFKKTFGEPIEGQYSGLAALNVLNSKGRVLYTRIADTKATTSKVVIKNGSSAVDGYTYFNDNSDIIVGTSNFSNQKIYTFDLTDTSSDGSLSKTFYVRSPNSAKSKMTLSNVYSQIAEQLSSTAGEFEFSDGSNKAGYYSYKIQETTDGGSNWTSINDNDLFMYLGTDSVSSSKLLTTLQSSISYGAPAQMKIIIDNDGAATGESNSGVAAGTYQFGMVVNGSAVQTLSVTFEPSDGTTLTYNDIADQLTSYISKAGYSNIYCYFEEGSLADTSSLVFINRTGTVAVTSINSEDGKQPSATDLFVYKDTSYIKTQSLTGTGISYILQTGESSTDYSIFDPRNASYVEFKGISVYNTETDAAETSINTDGFSLSYNSYTDSVVLTTSSTGSLYGVKIVDGDLGKGFVTSSGIDTICCLLGQPALSSTVSRSDKYIKFTCTSGIEYPVLSVESSSDDSSDDNEEYQNTDYFGDLYSLLGESTNVSGSYEVPSSQKDIIVFEAKEKGEGTIGTEVEVYTNTSATDSTIKYHYIDIIVNGTVKETFEKVSYDYYDDSNFVNLINSDSESGGSSYVQVVVVKNNADSDDIELSDGTYTIGEAASDDSVAYDNTTMEETDYNSYDYMVGDNGIVDDPEDLMSELIEDPENSTLANRDLYNYKILITPDCISEDIQNEAITLCETLGDSFYIADPPLGLTVASAVKWHNGKGGYGRNNCLSTKYAATYWPWGKIYNSYDSKYEWVMPSVFMAAKYCSVDYNYGSWYAPAGETNGILSIEDIEKYPNKTDRDSMYLGTNRVNPIIKYNDGSIIVFGEKTLYRDNSTLTKIHTRRMLIDIKQKLKNSLRGFIFLPSDTANLSKISAYAKSIMATYKTGGGVSSYTVTCDSTNNTTETLQQDIVYLDVTCVPVGCIEEVEVTLTLNSSTSTVSES